MIRLALDSLHLQVLTMGGPLLPPGVAPEGGDHLTNRHTSSETGMAY